MYAFVRSSTQKKNSRLGSLSLLSSGQGIHELVLRPIAACRNLKESVARKAAERLLGRLRGMEGGMDTATSDLTRYCA